MKETVVEWLFQELTNYYNLMSDYKTRQEILEKAKEMEKQQQGYSEKDMLNFAWFLIKNVGQYSDDRLAHFKGEYLKQFISIER